jgi:thiamine biosynthesis lipoprotein
MATEVTIQVVEPGPGAEQAVAAAREVFHRVEATCTRFDPDSPLMQANRDPEQWCRVPEECFEALSEAARAHVLTDGAFDPRVLDALVALGYDRSLPFREGPVRLAGRASAPTPGRSPADLPEAPVIAPRPPAHPWRPGLNRRWLAVRLGPHRIDLGGIGKGLAVRRAAQALADAGSGRLVEAGGDCHLGGQGPDGNGWRVGVEDPRGGTAPVAVLELSDVGCATSSLRVRSWQVGPSTVHHLIDPSTGRPAAGGLRSVTVVHADPGLAEVWSKALLVGGRDRIARQARAHGLAALWVDDTGGSGMSPAMTPHTIWTAG